jgi:hypothetical protein
MNLVEGDTEPVPIIVTGVDITGYVITLHIGYPTPLIKTATIINAPTGVAEVPFLSTDLVPGQYLAEVQTVKPGGIILTSESFLMDIRKQIA